MLFREFICPNALSASNYKFQLFAIIILTLLCTLINVSSAAPTEEAGPTEEVAPIEEAAPTEETAPLLKVEVYYEALCPDSKRFIRYQFYDAMIDDKLLNYTDMVLIPYGKVKKSVNPITEEVSLSCQHGSRECDLNALQACIIETNDNKLEQLQMIDCLMGGYAVDNCAQNMKIDITAALECKSSRSVADILSKYGKQTDAIDLTFVPSIGLDSKFDKDAQNSLLYDFSNAFCAKYKEKYNVLLGGCAR